MTRSTLHEGWRLRAVGGTVPGDLGERDIPAQVPGSTHLDLLAAGLIADPYLDRNEADLAWMHRVDWQYTTVFQAAGPPRGRAGGPGLRRHRHGRHHRAQRHVLGQTANMHRGYRFDVREPLREGTQRADRDAAVRARPTPSRWRPLLGWRQRAYPHPYNAIRKMACSFGWDWGPDLQTAGIWKPVRLERWDTARLARVRPLVTVDADGTGRVDVHARRGVAPRTATTPRWCTVGDREERVDSRPATPPRRHRPRAGRPAVVAGRLRRPAALRR